MIKSSVRNVISALSSTQLFGVVSQDDLITLTEKYTNTRRFQKNDCVFAKGSTEKCIGVILKGEATVRKEHIIISRLSEKDLFGTVTLYNNDAPFVNNIIAKTDCTVVFISKDGIDNLISKSPKFAKRYIEYLSERIYFLNGKIESYTMPTSDEKLLNYLNSVSDENGFVNNMKMTDLAKQMNISRASLYRAFDELESQGKIHRDGKTIKIF